MPPHTRQKRNGTIQEETGQRGKDGDNVKGETQSEHGDNTQPTTPRHSTGPPRTQKGDTTRTEGEPTSTAALQSPCHPPPHITPLFSDGPTLHHNEGGVDRGYPTTRTPQTHTRTRTPHTRQWNSARHDSSTGEYCNGMSRARAAPPHWAGQQQHTPPPFHTPRRMDTIHPSTHLLSHIHVHTTDEQR